MCDTKLEIALITLILIGYYISVIYRYKCNNTIWL